MVLPSILMLEDICWIFFHHTSLGSCLCDLGYQRLAANLTRIHEDAKHLYHPLGDEENANDQDVATPLRCFS